MLSVDIGERHVSVSEQLVPPQSQPRIVIYLHLLLLRKLHNLIFSDPGSKLAGEFLRTGLGRTMGVFREGF